MIESNCICYLEINLLSAKLFVREFLIMECSCDMRIYVLEVLLDSFRIHGLLCLWMHKCAKLKMENVYACSCIGTPKIFWTKSKDLFGGIKMLNCTSWILCTDKLWLFFIKLLSVSKYFLHFRSCFSWTSFFYYIG